METIVPSIVFIIAVFVAVQIFKKARVAQRAKLIDRYPFPPSLPDKVREKYPHLSDRELEQVVHGLREYFHLCNIAGRRMVSMPSQAVDIAWHEFILFTRKYEQFCKRALGRFLHHTPAEAMKSPTEAQAGIKTAWKVSCFRENLQPKSATKLPLLFAMDAALKIPDGFKYSLDCAKPGSNGYCAGHIGCGSGCGGCSGDSSGCSGGCGGD